MKTTLRFSLLFGLLVSINGIYANDQINPVGDAPVVKESNEDQIEPQTKQSENQNHYFEGGTKKSVSKTIKPCVSRECANSFVNIMLNSLPNEYMNSNKQNFFFLPFTIDLK